MKRIITLIFAFIICALCALSVLSAPTESDLTTLDRQKDIVIWVSWDTEKPSVVFLSPDGEEFDPSRASTSTTTIENDSSLYYVIKEAKAGDWRVRLDKGKNKTVDISVHDYSAGIRVEYFTIDEVKEDRLPVTFRVAGEDGQRYQYRISAMIDHSGAEKELRTGSSRVGDEQELEVRLNSLSSYDAYILKLYVWYDDNGTDIYDFAFSDSFAYKNESADEKAADFKMTVEPESSLVTVEWEKLDYSADSVLVALFEGDGAEPLLFDEYDPYDGVAELSYDPAASSVAIEVTVKYNGVNSAPVRKTARLDGDMLASIPDGSLFNSLQLPMSYKNAESLETDVQINDKNTKLVLDGDGNVNLKLSDDWNSVSISYTDGAGVSWRIAREIFVDRQAPVLNMSRSYDGMTVDGKTLTVSGTVIDCSRLTVNGEETEVGEGGAFSEKIELSLGENTITVTASDKAGNDTVYTATVVSGSASVGVEVSDGESDGTEEPDKWYNTLFGKGRYFVLLISSVLCILVLGYALIFWKKDKKGQKKDKKSITDKGDGQK